MGALRIWTRNSQKASGGLVAMEREMHHLACKRPIVSSELETHFQINQGEIDVAPTLPFRVLYPNNSSSKLSLRPASPCDISLGIILPSTLPVDQIGYVYAVLFASESMTIVDNAPTEKSSEKDGATAVF